MYALIAICLLTGSDALPINDQPFVLSPPDTLTLPADATQARADLVDPEGFVSAEGHAAAFKEYLEVHPFECPDLNGVYNKKRLYALLFSRKGALRHCAALDYLYATVAGKEGMDPAMVGEGNMVLGSQALKGVVDAERAACKASRKTPFFSVATVVYAAIYIAVHIFVCATTPARK